MTEMRILTVWNPWACAIIHQGKDVENRSRNIAGKYRGLVAIHVALRHDYTAVDALIQRTGHIGPENIYGYGAIIGVVDLVDVHHFDDCWDDNEDEHGRAHPTLCSPWADESRYHMEFANPRPLSQPIPYRGGQGLRWLPTTITQQVLALAEPGRTA